MRLLQMALQKEEPKLVKVALEELAEVHEGGVVAFDLDGTLAEYHGWNGVTHIGAPIPKMVERLKAYRAKNVNVIIFTARASNAPDQEMAMKIIQAWCLQNLNEILPITNEKTPDIVRLYDDRARQVLENTGEVVGE
jgi:hypothetical protein